MHALPSVALCLPWFEPALIAGALRDKGDLVFLDSSKEHERHGRYSYLAVEPFATLRVTDGIAYWNDQPTAAAPLVLLREKLDLYRLPICAQLPPFQGGAMGYFSYEFGRLLEQLPATRAPEHGSLNDLELMFYDAVCAFDHVERKTWVISTGFPHLDPTDRARRAQRRAQALEAAILDAQDALPTVSHTPPLHWRSNFTQPRYEHAVGEVIDSILAGDIFQANISQRFSATLPADFDPWAFYLRLRRTNASPFGAYIDRGETIIASSSPERFLKVEQQCAQTRPIKGTARRSADPQEDQRIAQSLAASEKDRAENLMIVDLLRNDFSRICVPGTVMTPQLCELESYEGVHHLVSTVNAELQPSQTGVELLGVSFPGGSITGAPKIKAMEIISRIEEDQRGIYCGAIGYFSFSGHVDTNIAIRTVLLRPAVATFQAGGGITALSNPEAEYRETLVKAERIFQAFGSGDLAF